MSNPPSNYDANFVYVGFNGYCHVEEANPFVSYPNNYLIRQTHPAVGVGPWGAPDRAWAFLHLSTPITRWNGLRFGLGMHRLLHQFPNLGWPETGLGIRVNFEFVTTNFDPATLTWATAVGLGLIGGGQVAWWESSGVYATPFISHLDFMPAFNRASMANIGATAYGIRIWTEDTNGPFANPWAAWSIGPNGGGATFNLYEALVIGQ